MTNFERFLFAALIVGAFVVAWLSLGFTTVGCPPGLAACYR